MFDVGFWELVLLFGLGLIILGPERLPKVAMQVGNWAGQARRMARQLSAQIRNEINDVGIQDPFSPTPTSDPSPEYSRPGVDDLKPTTPNDEPSQENSEEPEDDRSHADAAEDVMDDEADREDKGDGADVPADKTV